MAAEALQKEGIGTSVLHMATIKPLDAAALQAFAAEHGALVTVEEHSIIGGLGSAVAECLAECCPTKIARVGVNDRFGESGEPDELISFFGLDVPAIVAAAKRVVS
jgi:transketolase